MSATNPLQDWVDHTSSFLSIFERYYTSKYYYNLMWLDLKVSMGSTSANRETGGWLQMNQLSLRNDRVKFEIARNLPIILEEFIEYTPV